MRESNFVALYGHYMLKRIPIDFIFNVNVHIMPANLHQFCARKSNDFSFAWNSNCFSNSFFQKKDKEKFGGFTFICLLCHCSLAKFHFGVDKQGINT